MSRRIRRRREVRTDILENARFIAKDSVDVALRFFDAVDQTSQQLLEMPGMGGRMQLRSKAIADVRSCTVKGFPNHLIIYRPVKDGIEILAVVHGARHLPPIVRDRTKP